MKIGEILRQLADAIDAEGVDSLATPGEVMISPLQQTHELLKKAGGVENDVDTFAADDPKEIARLQQMAGIPQAAQSPVIHQTIVINTGGQGTPTVETTPAVSKVAESEPAKPVKKISYKDNYANISENDDCIIDIGDAYDRLREEFEALTRSKGMK